MSPAWMIPLLPALALAQVKADYARDIEPLFRTRCYLCHGPQQQMNNLRLDRADSARRVLDKIVPRVEGRDNLLAMPPTGARLTPEETGKLRAWIEQGAVWPAQSAAPVLWSFEPVRRPAVPAVRDAAWLRNPIDAFVRARLESEGLGPSPEAGRRTLVRRVSLDLTGLPPTPAEAAAFAADTRPDAYERLVDRLLASPHYGERWARPWLDLARYADSDGYEKDLPRPHAWRYRNWVIDALNRDLPYDQFTIQQIAGDLLPNATVEQRVATGFHRNTLTNREAGSSQAEIRFEQLVDRTNTVSTVWLGLTAGCAQCHDHKYDPIRQRDYYQLMAFFNSADEENIDAPLEGELAPYLGARPEYERQRASLLAENNVPALQAEWERNIRETLASPGRRLDWDFAVTSMTAMLDGARKILAQAPADRAARHAERLTDYFVSSPGPDNAKDTALTKTLRALRSRLQELERTLPPFAQAQALTENPAPPRNHLYVKGDYRNPGVEVQPAVFAALPPLPAGSDPSRLALARWLVSRDNPLTARVAVNRMWHEFFGRGLAKTVEDFGTQGERPTHPELLDFLAAEFMDRGWSTKAMHRLIVTSAAYRQSSKARADLADRDPDNTLVARQARLRLSAELLRDEALAAGGLLHTAVGGPSVRPPQPKSVAELTYANSFKYVESTGADRYRRGLYTHFQRTAPHPQLMNFDAPDSHVTCTRRRRSNTPLQALNLLNDPVFLEAAQGVARRTLREAPENGFEDRLRYAFALCLGREPAAHERGTLRAYFQKQQAIVKREPKAAAALGPAPAWTGLASVLLNLDEFITRE